MWIIDFIESVRYLGILVAMFFETYVPIVQSEIVMTFAGSASADGSLSIWLVILVGVIGSELGALSLYFLARKLERDKTLSIISRYGAWLGYERSDFDKADNWLQNHQRSAVFIGRFIPGIRSFVAIPAGIQKMKVWEFALLNLAGVVVWVSVLAGLGYYLTDQYQIVSRFSSYITYGFIIFFVLFVGYRTIKITIR